MTGINVVLAIWAIIGMFGLIGMVKLVDSPAVWKELAPVEQNALAELANLPRWLLFGTLASQMVKATLYCAAAFGYFTRHKLWGRIGGSALGVWLLAEQAVLVAVVGHVSWGLIAAAAYGLLTLWVVNVAARDAFVS